MLAIAHAFAHAYRNSAAGRRGAVRDYTLDYEKFLRLAGAADGDPREIAELELLALEAQSGGLFAIDREPRSGTKLRLRLAREGGEAWLFAQLGASGPSEERQKLVVFFEQMAEASVPEKWQISWQEWCASLAHRARDGEAIPPFRRDDPEGNAELYTVLIGILNWQRSALVRYVSTQICGDSKRLQLLEPRLTVALFEVTGQGALEHFGISRKPRSITLHGPLMIPVGDQTIDCSLFSAPVSLSEGNFDQAQQLFTSAPLCLTVENEDVFYELAATNPGVLIVQTSFPGSAAIGLLRRLPAGLPFHHFGDSDPAGSDILRDLREKTGREIRPLLMHYRPTAKVKDQPLSEQEVKTIKRLLETDQATDLRGHLEEILAAGGKGCFEQEAIPVEEVWAALRPFLGDWSG